MDKIHSVVITGANRGIGLEFVKQFLTNPSVKSRHVIATCRSPEQASALKELQRSYSNLFIIKLNVTEFDTYESVVNDVRNIVGDKGLTLLINNAGILPWMPDLESLNGETFMSVLATNSAAPLLLTKAFHPLLKQSAQANAEWCNNGLSILRSAVVNISSYAGSIAWIGSAKTWKPPFGYCESKAALNMSTQIASKLLEEEGILVESFHPGVVATDMMGSIGQIDACTSVTGMLKVILSLHEKNKNGFYSWEGDVLPF